MDVKNCLNCVLNCDDHGLLDFKSAVQYMKTFHISLHSLRHVVFLKSRFISMSKMADGVLVKKVFNYICISGGFVELTSLLGNSSPLKWIESKRECKNWLNRQGSGLFVVMTNGDLEGVRVQLKTKICKYYFDGESCSRTQENCNSWHICKDFLENHCFVTSKCCRSHDFFDVNNKEKTKQLGIAKFPNSTIKKIVGWSLPQVCQLYLKGECSSDDCFYLHVCSKAVQGFDCGCSLSHNLLDNHNQNVLKKFDLAPHKRLPIECGVRQKQRTPIEADSNDFPQGDKRFKKRIIDYRY